MAAAARRAFVLGGGVAGIAASFALRDRGYDVELLEARRELGGRVFSFQGDALGDEIDNGPHVMLGCYDEMRRLLRRLGTEQDFEQPRSLCMHYRAPGGASDALRLVHLPAPVALPLAVMRLRALSFAERARALRGMIASLRRAPAGWSLERWLHARAQHGGPRRYLWEPLCHAVMNAEPEEVSAELFLATLRRAFRGSARRAAIWMPRKPWSAIVGRAAVAALSRAGVRVCIGTRVQRLDLRDGAITAIGTTPERDVAETDLVVSALPWHRLARLLPAELAEPATRFEGRAIVNVCFDFGAEPVLGGSEPVTALVGGRPFQFVYRRPGDPAGRFTLIAAGGRELEGKSVAAIEAEARGQLARYYPDAPLPAALRVRVTKERDATLCASPEVAAQRPRAGRHAAVRNLWLCGDWTHTGLPSTLEGAAASGFAVSPDGA